MSHSANTKTTSAAKIRPHPRKPNVLREIQASLVYALILTLGASALFGAHPGGRTAGALVALIGASGLAWHLRGLWRLWQTRQAEQAAAERRKVLQTARRARTAQEREQRRAQRQAKAKATARVAELRTAQKEAARRRAAAEAEQRAAREQVVEAEVTRLRRLDDARLVAEVAALFAQRGQTPQPSVADAACDLILLSEPTGSRDVARCVPVGQIAGVTDVQAVEAWRLQENARQAYLIAPAGFSPAAVRQASRLPITLVEPYLLAQWSIEQNPTVS